MCTDNGDYFKKTYYESKFLLSKLAVWARFGPNLVNLTHFVNGVGSSNLRCALTVVITFRNVLRVKIGCFGRIWPKFSPNLGQFGSFKSLKELALCQQRSVGAHDSQKHAQTQNLESVKSKIAEIFLPYFHPIQSARSLN